ncbi:MAG: hypothetical protein VW405_19745 [Rhodospirillaceae bacterium]
MVRVVGILALLVALVPSAASAQSGYTQWKDPNAPAGGSTQDFVDKLNALVDKAERARAADPNFLRDLRDLAGQFDRPWGATVFNDDFLDGNHTADPAWTVVSGNYWVERGWGLRS